MTPLGSCRRCVTGGRLAVGLSLFGGINVGGSLPMTPKVLRTYLGSQAQSMGYEYGAQCQL